MAERPERQVVWLASAQRQFNKTLAFWVEHNKSNTYSAKLEKQIYKLLGQVAMLPEMGKATGREGIRIIIKDYFHIFYRVTPDQIVVLIFWDSRRNPTELKL